MKFTFVCERCRKLVRTRFVHLFLFSRCRECLPEPHQI